jgi:hypothetical protein
MTAIQTSPERGGVATAQGASPIGANLSLFPLVDLDLDLDLDLDVLVLATFSRAWYSRKLTSGWIVHVHVEV